MIKLTPSEVTALKELVAAGPRGRKSRAVRRDLARLIRAHYVTEQSASMDTVIYVPLRTKPNGEQLIRHRQPKCRDGLLSAYAVEPGGTA
jgi:hypothetical protein